MSDYSAAPNCDIDSTYIDMHQRAIYEQQKRKTEQNEDKKKAMKFIRKNFICTKCHKYPGDDEWSFGSWHNGPYTCFDCT